MKQNKRKILPFSQIPLLLCSLFLASCATNEVKQKPIEKPVDTKVVEIPVEREKTAAELLAQVKKINQENTHVTLDSLILLVQASEQYLKEDKAKEALWLANNIAPMLVLNPSNAAEFLTLDKNAIAELADQVTLIKTQSLMMLNENEKALAQLQKTQQSKTQLSSQNQLRYYQLSTDIYQHQQRLIHQVDASLRAFDINKNADTPEIEDIWQQINQLADWQLQQLIKLKPPYIKGWAVLSFSARKYGASPSFNVALTRWQKNYSHHPAFIISEQLLMKASEENLKQEVSNITVILPLSGNQKNAGIAAQQGILAAYHQHDKQTITFIDSETLVWENLTEQLATSETQFVIGPLLRRNVELYLLHAPADLPALLLNLPEKHNLSPVQVALSMRPEDEAIQAATTLAEQQFKHPIVLSHQDSVSQRIAQAFIDQWQHETNQQLEIVYFEQGKAMQDNLKSSLDIIQSLERINEIDARIKRTIMSEPRNRRDVDMIYVVGTPTQTRLLKPYIDVNIAPFAEAIPIFASSRSHSVKDDSGNTRDLEGLTFTEIPWLLSSKQQNKELAELSQQLFPQLSDSLQRIFAMGYDSMQLIPSLAKMSTANYVRYYGQLGVLQLNNDNILTRSLLWGRYSKEQVEEIVME